MTDIIVRIPAGQIEHFYDDKLYADSAFWRFNGRPQKLAAGEFIWFTLPEGTKAGAKVEEITDRIMDSTDPSGKWNVTFDALDIPNPSRPSTTARRGFATARRTNNND